MSRLSPDQHVLHVPSEQAKAWLAKPDNMDLVIGCMIDWARKVPKVFFRSKPGARPGSALFWEPLFGHEARGKFIERQYCGASLVDFANDMTIVAIEAALGAVDSHLGNDGPGRLVKTRIESRLTDALPVWQETVGRGSRNPKYEAAHLDEPYWLTEEALSGIEQSMPDADLLGVEDNTDQLADRQVVQEALGALTSEEAYVLRLHAQHGWTFEEIGRELHRDKSTVKRIYDRACEKAREAVS